MDNPSDFEVVSKVQGLETAYIIKGHLESEGIPVEMRYDVAGKIYGIICDGLGEIRLLVPKEVAEEAKRILKEAENKQGNL
jgi:hypothetical protein